MIKLVILALFVSALEAADRCDTDLHPTLQVKGSCMEITDCDAIGGIYEHNWCMSKSATVKCCFKKEETKTPDVKIPEVIDYNAPCAYTGQFLPHPDPTKFYHCAHGWKFLFDCPEGQVWFQDKSWCDYPTVDSFWQDLLSDFLSDSDNFDYWPSADDSDIDLDSILGGTNTVSASSDRCDTEDHPDYGKGVCKEKSDCQGVYVNNWCQSKAASIKCCFETKNWDNICKSGTLHAHQDPTKFIQCVWGQPITMYCPDGQIWISEKHWCDYPPNEATGSSSGSRLSTSFLRQVEGFRADAYCLDPKEYPKSGVTIGIGVDFGSKNAQQLRDAGVSESIINKVSPYFGLTGNDACSAVLKNKVVLTDKEAMELSDAVIKIESDEVAKKYNIARSASAKAFDDLTCAQRTVIASVLYQYGSPSRVPKFWAAVTSNNWAAVISELRNFGDAYSSRRNKEADLLEFGNDSKTCPGPLSDTCEVTKGSCVQRSSCGSKYLSNFCQHQASTVICCLSAGSTSTGTTSGQTVTNRVASIREAIADEAFNAAEDKSLGLCAKYVRQAIERAYEQVTGSPLAIERTTSAKDYGPKLIKAGFKVASEPLQKGDVAIFDAIPDKHPHGHIEIYTGTGWVSDFKQKSMYAAQAYIGKTPTFYRYG